MTDLIKETRDLAKAYSVTFKDCGNGHVQLTAHGNLINYWPNSKKKSVYSPTLDRRESHVLPWDAVKLCLSEAKKGMRVKKPTGKTWEQKKGPGFSLDNVTANPSGLKHFYSGYIPPWEGDGFEFESVSDELRYRANRLRSEAICLVAQANEMDKAAVCRPEPQDRPRWLGAAQAGASMGAGMKNCGNCEHFAKISTGRAFSRCEFIIPKLPSSCHQPHKIDMHPDEGTKCPCHEPKKAAT